MTNAARMHSVTGSPTAPVAAGDRALWWAWTRWATLGEFSGFAVPAVVGAVISGWPAAATLVAMVAAGAVEGSLLGWSQWWVLRRRVPQVRAGAWVGATAAAAALAWSIGMLPSLTDGELPSWPPVLLVLAAGLLGLVLLASIGTAQWWVLRAHVPRCGRWVLTTAGAWLAGLTVFSAFTMPLWQPGQAAWLVAIIGLAGGLLMAVTVAAITGWGFLRLSARAP